MNTKKVEKKFLLPFLLVIVGFALFVLSQVILIPLIGWSFSFTYKYIFLLCILPAILLLTLRSGKNCSRILLYISFGILGLQLISNLIFFASYLFSFSVPMVGFFLRIPGCGVLGGLYWAISQLFNFQNYGMTALVSFLVSMLGAIADLLAILSNLCFMLVCSEFCGFHQLDGPRAALYRMIKAKDNCPDAADTENSDVPNEGFEEKEAPSMDYSDYSRHDQGDVPAELLTRRGIATAVILSLVTCGIYNIIWNYSIMKKIRMLNRDQSSASGELLCFLFVPFYALYWYYSRAERLSVGAAAYGIPVSNNGILYLLLAIFALPIVSTCLMQNDLNTIADTLNGTATIPNVGTQASQEFHDAVDGVTGPFKQKADGKKDSSALEQLEKLAQLHEQGVLTDEEFNEKKAELLKRI